jgi:hypothetical protein
MRAILILAADKEDLMRTILIFACALLVVPALALESLNFKLTEQALNGGGTPVDGAVMASPRFRMTLAAVGDGVGGVSAGSASFRIDGGSVRMAPPPGEVYDLHFADAQTLAWKWERSAGSYNLYRDLISNLAGLAYGSCAQEDIPIESTVESLPPPAEDGFFYLVTAKNSLEEEGTKGADSSGTWRDYGTACP